jgi:hypothetical protein
MEVRVRATPQPSEAPVVTTPPVGGPEPTRPRRKPMVEVAGPRRAPVVQPVPTITVDIPMIIEPDEEEAAPSPPPPVTPPSIDMPWYAEDIERLPEANVDLGQLALESVEPLPPLPLRPDVPSRTGTSPARPPGTPASQLLGK